MKKGFTLVEMLVVIGIIAILIGASISGYSAMAARAQKARAQETVSNVATALAVILEQRGKWPKAIVDNVGKDDYRLNDKVAVALAAHKALSLSYKQDEKTKAITMTGFDKYGVLDPWGIEVMRRNANAGRGTAVPSGGTIADHIIRYSVDVDGRGFTEVSIGGSTFKVRASAAAWCCGMDGKIESFSKAGRCDDVYSFGKNQRVNE